MLLAFLLAVTAPADTIPGPLLLRPFSLARGGNPSLVMGFAFSGMPSSFPLVNGHRRVEVRVQLQATREGDHREFFLDSTRVYDVIVVPTGARNASAASQSSAKSSTPRKEYNYFPMMIEMPLEPGRYQLHEQIWYGTPRTSASETVSWLGTYENTIQSFEIHEYRMDSLAVESLVLGWVEAGVAWRGPTRDVIMNPVGTWVGNGVATMYSQIRGLIPNRPYSVTIDLFPVDSQRVEVSKSAFTATFDEKAPGAQSVEWIRDLGLNQLKIGNYRVQLTVHNGLSSAVNSDWMTIDW